MRARMVSDKLEVVRRAILSGRDLKLGIERRYRCGEST